MLVIALVLGFGVLKCFGTEPKLQTRADYAQHCNREPKCILTEISNRKSRKAISNLCKDDHACVNAYYHTYLSVGPSKLLDIIKLCGTLTSCSTSAEILVNWEKLEEATEFCHHDPLCIVTIQSHRLKDYTDAHTIMSLCQYSLSCIHSTSKIARERLAQILEVCEVSDYQCIRDKGSLSHVEDEQIAKKIRNICKADQGCERGYEPHYKYLKRKPKKFLALMEACKDFTECLRYADMLFDKNKLAEVLDFCEGEVLCTYTIGINRLSDYASSNHLIKLCKQDIPCIRSASYVPLPISQKEQVINVCEGESNCIRSVGIMIRGDTVRADVLMNSNPNLLKRITSICSDNNGRVETYCLDRLIALPWVWSFHQKVKACRGRLMCVHKILIEMTNIPNSCLEKKTCEQLAKKLSQYEMGKELVHLCDFDKNCMKTLIHANKLKKAGNKELVSQYCEKSGYCNDKHQIANLGSLVDYALLCRDVESCQSFSSMSTDAYFFQTMDHCAEYGNTDESIRACYSAAQFMKNYAQRQEIISRCRGEHTCIGQ